uniref:Uncharacterized protein n=1 Tax=Phytophthora ramorum TaxID=164328 RepID=H3HA12_PHYRM
MLVSMIYFEKLDSTPWTQYAPEMYFLRAETRLEHMFARNLQLEPWHPLVEVSSSDGDSPFDPETVDKEEMVDDAEGEAEVEYLKTNVLEEKLKSLTVLSSSDSEDSAPRSTPQRSSQNMRSKDSNSHSGSARKKARLNSKTNYIFSSRYSTPLADMPFQDLSLEQLCKIEIVDPDITSSFRYFGFKMYFFGKKSKAQLQGFSNYAPQKARFASKLSPAIMAGLTKFVSFMEDHGQAWWELLHWITIDPDQDEESQVLYDGASH